MTLEHFALLMRFRNGDNLSPDEVRRLAQFEGPWVLELWLEEQTLGNGGMLPV